MAKAAHGATPALVNALVDEARGALDPAVLEPEAAAALAWRSPTWW